MKRVTTGISGLDEMLGGGFLSNRIVLIRGGPGTGKTVFSLQFVVKGAEKGEKGIYITLEEPLDLVRKSMASLGFDLKDFEEKNLLKLIDGSQMVYNKTGSEQRRSYGGPKSTMAHVANQIKYEVENFGAKRLVVDPITSAIIQQRFPTDKRLEILELVKVLRKLPCTSVITSESAAHSEGGEFFVEEYLADGSIVLSKALRDFVVFKTLRVEKMRGTGHDDQPRKYEITEKGFVVYNTEPVTV